MFRVIVREDLRMTTTAPQQERDEYMRSPELAAYRNIGEQRPAKWRLTGYGPPYVKAGKTVLYRRRDVDQWAANKLRKSTSDEGPTA